MRGIGIRCSSMFASDEGFVKFDVVGENNFQFGWNPGAKGFGVVAVTEQYSFGCFGCPF